MCEGEPMSHPFDLFCKNHPERLVCNSGRPDHLCEQCYENAYNAGAAIADATWWQQPHERSVGHTYKRLVFKGDQGPVMVEQIEDWK